MAALTLIRAYSDKAGESMKHFKRILSLVAAGAVLMPVLSGCNGVTRVADAATNEKRIVRIGHNQQITHPIHTSLLEFKDYIEDRLGDKYDIEIFPSELLGTQPDMVELTQTGAIDFCVASTAILESFSPNCKLFNLPYLFASPEAYHAVMEDEELTGKMFDSCKKGGFEYVTWFDAGARSFYTVNKPIKSPADLKGLKIRVQQSPTNVEMMDLLGGSATPITFGEVYTALQSHIIDGAENNELSLTDNGHGDICKYYSYDMHQMLPDILIGNCDFMDSLPAEDREVFDEGFKLLNETERKQWDIAVAEAKETAEKEKGVTFNYPDVQPFMDACLPLHQMVLDKNPEIAPVYEAIQAYNDMYSVSDSVE
jgi:tripartite ATP-independent transporter DctP family solute receptor